MSKSDGRHRNSCLFGRNAERINQDVADDQVVRATQALCGVEHDVSGRFEQVLPDQFDLLYMIACPKELTPNFLEFFG